MSWFKVDDSFSDHPKVKSIPRAKRKGAVALWTLAGSWAARQLTDGPVPADVEDFGASKADAKELVASGLWHAPGHACDRCPPVAPGYYLFHDWLIYQRSREEVLAERAAAAARQRKARDAAKARRDADRDSDEHTNESHDHTHAVTHAVSTDSVTVPPTRPDPISTSNSPMTAAAEPATARDPEQQQLDDLRHELNRQGLTVAWSNLAVDFQEELLAHVATHGVATLVATAKARADPAKPARHVAAWRDTWNNLAPPQTPSTPAEAFARLQARYEKETP